MKVKVEMKAMVINKSSQKNEKNGNIYYGMNVAQQDDAGRISITEEVFNLIEPMKEYLFVAEFNDKYGSFRVVNVDLGKVKA
ncbi:MAG TPA: hypothetical protein H9887_03455 [Candidatus Dorea intestinavium]|nr:hypothetical protein [Candidatus Dorea intestinavium]